MKGLNKTMKNLQEQPQLQMNSNKQLHLKLSHNNDLSKCAATVNTQPTWEYIPWKWHINKSTLNKLHVVWD